MVPSCFIVRPEHLRHLRGTARFWGGAGLVRRGALTAHTAIGTDSPIHPYGQVPLLLIRIGNAKVRHPPPYRAPGCLRREGAIMNIARTAWTCGRGGASGGVQGAMTGIGLGGTRPKASKAIILRGYGTPIVFGSGLTIRKMFKTSHIQEVLNIFLMSSLGRDGGACREAKEDALNSYAQALRASCHVEGEGSLGCEPRLLHHRVVRAMLVIASWKHGSVWADEVPHMPLRGIESIWGAALRVNRRANSGGGRLRRQGIGNFTQGFVTP